MAGWVAAERNESAAAAAPGWATAATAVSAGAEAAAASWKTAATAALTTKAEGTARVALAWSLAAAVSKAVAQKDETADLRAATVAGLENTMARKAHTKATKTLCGRKKGMSGSAAVRLAPSPP